MSVVWGPLSGHLRLGIDISQYVPTVGPNDSYVNLTITYKWRVEGYGYSYNATANFSGAIGGSQGFSINVPYGGTAEGTIATKSYTVATSYSSSVAKTFGVSTSTFESNASTSRSWTVARRPYGKPATPTSLSVTRSSDTKASLTWDYTSTSAAPVVADAIDRQSVGDPTWRRVATLNPAGKSWTDTGIKANDRYQWRVRTGNNSGDSAWAYFAWVSTTPDPPSAVTAAKNVDGSITVTWAPPSPTYGTNFLILDNGTQVGSTTRDQSTWTHTSPSTSTTHTYTVRTYESSGTLTSADSAPSNTVQLLAPPNSPTSLTPNGAGAAVEAGDPVLSWVHAPVDSSAQTSAQVRWRPAGGSWTTVDITGTTMSTTIGGLTVGSFEWQVRTRGAYMPADEAGWGPWSAVATFSLVNIPGVSIQTPEDGGHVSTSTLTTTWSYYQAQGHALVSSQVQVIGGDGTLLVDQTLTGTVTSLLLPITLADQATYTIRARSKSSDNLWSPWDQATITVAYPHPLDPIVTAMWDPTMGAATVSIINPQPDPASILQVLIDADGRPYI